jgi:hypothetical protein
MSLLQTERRAGEKCIRPVFSSSSSSRASLQKYEAIRLAQFFLEQDYRKDGNNNTTLSFSSLMHFGGNASKYGERSGKVSSFIIIIVIFFFLKQHHRKDMNRYESLSSLLLHFGGNASKRWRRS